MSPQKHWTVESSGAFSMFGLKKEKKVLKKMLFKYENFAKNREILIG